LTVHSEPFVLFHTEVGDRAIRMPVGKEGIEGFAIKGYGG